MEGDQLKSTLKYALVVTLVALTISASERLDLHSVGEKKLIVPRVYERTLRLKRDVASSSNATIKFIDLGDWLLKLHPEENSILSPGLKTEWININNSETLDIPHECSFHSGNVEGIDNSIAAITMCESSIIGFFTMEIASFFLEPIEGNGGEHVLYSSQVKQGRIKRSSDPYQFYTSRAKYWMYNLTGDVIDIGNDGDGDGEQFQSENGFPEKDFREEGRSISDEENYTDVNSFPGGYGSDGNPISPEFQRSWHRERILDDEEEEGYLYDTAWTTNSISIRKPDGMVIPTRWLEIAIAVDHTLISFHGRNKVEKYVLALMNIVNAIYQDPSLDANIRLVVSRLLIYEHKKHRVIHSGNAKKSLESVNLWNRRLYDSLKPQDPHHDIAVWLTKSDIGGPSGYAPVAGVCDPKRSCALNRDEGLTSAFIIAHEMAHILGLSHDGDAKSNNTCKQDDSSEWTVMAPMVSATFNKFSWSECSKKEFRQNRDKWTCLLNEPNGAGEIKLNSTLRSTFTMDEQCRMEFGHGYSLCRAFEITDPCAHLWCGHKDTPLICKSKKGAPLEGTECGAGKWCVNGYCQNIGNKSIDRVPVVLNPRNGAWGNWTSWGACSRTCGIGVQFRSRKCDSPSPSYGGEYCKGTPEQWKICKNPRCPQPVSDLRAQQCKYLPKILGIENQVDANFTWLPYESEQDDDKCKLTCINVQKKKLYVTNENLIDGTLCSYENSDNVCIQGTCYDLGCDGELNSELKRDRCGICGGNNTDCSEISSTMHKVLKREITRISVLPKMAMEMKLEVKLTTLSLNSSLAFILKNRKNNKYIMVIPNTSIHSRIFEGTKFNYQINTNGYKFWSKGPLSYELVLLVVLPNKDTTKAIKVTSNSKYTIDKKHTKPSKRYVWTVGGWGPCSASCGGGRRKKTTACWDNQKNKIVRRSYCSLSEKPKLLSEKCNEYGCDFEWVSGEWEPCTKTCGDQGVQSREIYCMPNSMLNNTFGGREINQQYIWSSMVNPKKCPIEKPTAARLCNRVPCVYYWTLGQWSQCSASCGSGFQTRNVFCPLQEENYYFSCDDQRPAERRHCKGSITNTKSTCKPNQNICHKDDAKMCSLDQLQKYCQLKKFRKVCCKSCKVLYTTS